MYSLPAMVAFGIIACSMPEVFADYPQRHLLATSWALCFRKIYVYHIIIFVLDQIMNAKIRIFSVSAKFSSIFRNRYVRYSRASVIILWLAVLQSYVYRSRLRILSSQRIHLYWCCKNRKLLENLQNNLFSLVFYDYQ